MQQKPQPIIRHATRDEISEIADLIVASLVPFRSVVSGEVLDRYIAYSRDVEGRWSSGVFLVIESNGVIAGTVTYVDHRRQPGQHRRRAGRAFAPLQFVRTRAVWVLAGSLSTTASKPRALGAPP